MFDIIKFLFMFPEGTGLGWIPIGLLGCYLVQKYMNKQQNPNEVKQ